MGVKTASEKATKPLRGTPARVARSKPARVRRRGRQDGRLKILEAMEEVGPLLTTLDMNEVQRRTIDAAMRLVNAEAASFMRVAPDTGDLYFDVALGDAGERVRTVRLKAGEGIAGQVAQTGVPILVQDVTDDYRFSKRADRLSGFTTRSILCVPVTLKGARIGVLQAVNKRKGKFSKIDLEGLSALASQVAIAVENNRLYHELHDTFLNTASALGDAIEAKDAYTAGHTRRVMEYSLIVARKMNLTPAELDALNLAAALHDIGKIGIEDCILRKPGRLDPEEMRIMKTHSLIGARIVENIPQLRAIVPGIRYHHERYDGNGYPDGLRGEAIPTMARIIAVCDTFDAMTSDRPYRKGLPVETAIQELRRYAGTQFDPEVVDLFVAAFDRGAFDAILKKVLESPAPPSPPIETPIEKTATEEGA